jgi:hypothetical protein
MIYRLLHRLFGWDYIAWQNSAAQGIARVRVDWTGRVWYWRHKSIQVADVITNPFSVLWLTCPPSKYFPERRTYYGGDPAALAEVLKAEQNVITIDPVRH